MVSKQTYLVNLSFETTMCRHWRFAKVLEEDYVQVKPVCRMAFATQINKKKLYIFCLHQLQIFLFQSYHKYRNI